MVNIASGHAETEVSHTKKNTLLLFVLHPPPPVKYATKTVLMGRRKLWK